MKDSRFAWCLTFVLLVATILTTLKSLSRNVEAKPESLLDPLDEEKKIVEQYKRVNELLERITHRDSQLADLAKRKEKQDVVLKAYRQVVQAYEESQQQSLKEDKKESLEEERLIRTYINTSDHLNVSLQKVVRVKHGAGKEGAADSVLVDDEQNEFVLSKSEVVVPQLDGRLLVDLAVAIVASTVGGLLAFALQQPQRTGFLLGGYVIGPHGLGMIRGLVQIKTLAQFGATFIVFVASAESIVELRQQAASGGAPTTTTTTTTTTATTTTTTTPTRQQVSSGVPFIHQQAASRPLIRASGLSGAPLIRARILFLSRILSAQFIVLLFWAYMVFFCQNWEIPAAINTTATTATVTTPIAAATGSHEGASLSSSLAKSFLIGATFVFASATPQKVITSLQASSAEQDNRSFQRLAAALFPPAMAILLMLASLYNNRTGRWELFCEFAALGGVTWVCYRTVWPKLLQLLSRQSFQDLVLLALIGVCISFTLGCQYSACSDQLGAFVAGIIISGRRGSSTSGDEAVVATTAFQPIRDIFAALYLASIGMLLNPSDLSALSLPVSVAAVSLVLVKVVVTLCSARASGWSAKPSQHLAAVLCFPGEMSFVFAFELLHLGVVDKEMFFLILYTILGSTLVLEPLVRLLRRKASTDCLLERTPRG